MLAKSIQSLIFLLLAIPAFGQISSTFDNDAEGWVFRNASSAILQPVYSATGGNPGGYPSVTYSASTSAGAQVWIAPAKFLGNHAVLSLGLNLKFDLQQSQAGTSSSGFGDVRIVNGSNITLVYSLPAKPAVAPAWSSYSLKLDETQGWRVGSTTGLLATRSQVILALTSVTAIEVRGTYATNAAYVSGIDNVVLEQQVLSPAPVISSFSPAKALPGATVTISGSNFGTAADNVVYIGNRRAEVKSASSTQLTIEVPVNVPFGYITVFNKAIALAGTSATQFVPLFNGGGRIIPSSFEPRVDITSTTSVDGFKIADVDGDGLQDLVIASENNDRVEIFRNLGVTGTISASQFAPPFTLFTGRGSINGTGLRIADLDGDGVQDIITSGASTAFTGAFITFRNLSTPGSFAFEAPELWTGLQDDSPIIDVVDVDGDGRPDLMGCEGSAISAVTSYFWITQNISTPGNIEFAASRNFDFDLFSAVSGAYSGDLNGDGKPEIVVKTDFSNNLWLFENQSSPGRIALGTPFILDVPGTVYGGVNFFDLNEDGKTDLIWKAGSSVYVRTNSSTGGALKAEDFASGIQLSGDLGLYGGVGLADINGDGKADLITSDDADAGVYENVYSGGAFTTEAFIPAYRFQGLSNSTYPTTPVGQDLNGDGKPEMIFVITNTIPDRIGIFQNSNIRAPEISL